MPIVNDGNNGMYMPVAPINYGGMGGGMGGWSDGWWIILLLLCGWGGMGGMGGLGGMMGGLGLGVDFPWLLNGQTNLANGMNSGFDHAATQSALGDIRTSMGAGFGDVQTSLCSGFAGVNATVNGVGNAITQRLYDNELANLNRSFDAQTASMQGMNGIQAKLADCCCENRLATESLRATVLQENCQDRYEAQGNTRDIITALTAGIQSIKDEICADRLEGYKRENDNLRSQLTAANLAASQIAQTAQIVDQTYARLSTCPVGTVPVYGETPIFRCNGNGGCGGYNGFAN